MKSINNDFKGKSGIYCLINIQTNKRYVGSSKNLLNRLSTHRSYLRDNKHQNQHLQNAWNKYGENAFDYYILEFCEEGILTIREQFYIDTLKPEYNITKEVIRNTPSEESRGKMSKTRKEKIQSGDIIFKTKRNSTDRSIYQYSLDGNFIKEWESATVAAKALSISFSSIYRCLNKEYKKGSNFLWGFDYLDTIPAYSKNKKDGNYLNKKVKVVVDDNTIIFDSLKDCASYFLVSGQAIGYAIRNSGIYKKIYMISYISGRLIE